MKGETDLIKTIFGLKLKTLRQKNNWSLQEFSDKTGLSKSYLNEIEHGKKYPKHDKILVIAEALGCEFNDLVSTKMDKSLNALSEIINSEFYKELPLELFGISRIALVGLVSEAPKKVTAFLNTLVEISQNYNVSKEKFYYTVLRSFQEMHDNFFPEIEKAAFEFTDILGTNVESEYHIETLEKILCIKFGYRIEYTDFNQQPKLTSLRSLYVPEKNLLFINQRLHISQKIFILCKELGYNVLHLEPRPYSYSWFVFRSFEELLNNFYASYFAGCILIPKLNFEEKLRDFFSLPNWDSNKFESFLFSCTDSPETFYYRLTNILPQEFGIKDLFYLCFVKRNDTEDILLLKELHLNSQQAPHANATHEHYCRRWIAVKNLENLNNFPTITSVQISDYKDTGKKYLVISTAHTNPFSDGKNRSYCIGILLNPSLSKKIGFVNDTSIPSIPVGVTCETCNILDCEVRQAPPIILNKKKYMKEMAVEIAKLRNSVL